MIPIRSFFPAPAPPPARVRAALPFGALAAALLLLAARPLPSKAAEAKDNEGLEFVNLAVGIQHDYKLPKNYRSLKLEGNYKKFTGAVHLKKLSVLRFTPRTKGTGALIVKHSVTGKILKKLAVHVLPTHLHKKAAEVTDLLTAVDGVRVRIMNQKVIVDGEVMLPRDMARIAEITRAYGVQSFVKLSPDAQNQTARLIEEAIGNPSVTVRVIYNNYILEGTVQNEAEKKSAWETANLYANYNPVSTPSKAVQIKQTASGNNVINNIIVSKPSGPKDDRKKLIQITVHYVELKKDYNKGFLFEWKPGIADGGTRVTVSAGGPAAASRKLTSVLSATISNLFPKLNWAKSFGFARVLHNSNLLVEAGHKGNITSNVQIPYTVNTPQGTETKFADINITTDVTPTLKGPKKNSVHMEVHIQVKSHIGQTSAGPIIAGRTINTALHVQDGLSAALGGLVSSTLTRDYNRQPQSGFKGGGQAPPRAILPLFAARSYDANRSQFVAFITPVIRSSASAGAGLIKSKFRVNQD